MALLGARIGGISIDCLQADADDDDTQLRRASRMRAKLELASKHEID